MTPRAPKNPGDRARRLFEAGRIIEAERLLKKTLAHRPTEPLYNLLARLLWLENRRQEFDALCDQLIKTDTFCFCGLELLRQAEQHEKTLSTLASLPAKHRQNIRFFLNAAWTYIQLDDGERAHQCARPAFESQSTEATADAYVTSLLMIGEHDQAAQTLSALVATQTDNRRWLAYQFLLDRMTSPENDERYKALIQVFNLKQWDPLEDHAAFNDSLRDAVSQIYKFRQHPLDQSLIGGKQTAVNLVDVKHPALQRYLRLASEAVATYRTAIHADGAHLGAKTLEKLTIQECWSVLLDGGRHKPHFHPEGVVSGTYYLTVPQAQSKGAIYFGVPPFASSIKVKPLLEYEPEEGALILFPSYFWHGTYASTAGLPRQTLPFDAA